jgi:hypothetical protein
MKKSIDGMEEIISAGFDLVNSIRSANWDYNGGKGLPHKTEHMGEACDNWIKIMKQFNRNLGVGK